MSAVNTLGIICEVSFDRPKSGTYMQYDIGGTLFFRNVAPITEEENVRYSCGVGEIYVSNLRPNVNPKCLMDIFLQLGEIFIFRFKKTVFGQSRGYAFLQYRDMNLVQTAIDKLPSMCRARGIPHVRASLNLHLNSLWLQHTDHYNPLPLFSKLRDMNIPMQRIIAYEYDWHQYEYEIKFKCNRDVAVAWHHFNLIKQTLGPNTLVSLDSNNIPYSTYPRCKRYSLRQCLSKSVALCTPRLNDL